MSPRAGLDDIDKRQFLTLPGLELRLLGRPARSQSLYRIRYSVYRVLFQCLRNSLELFQRNSVASAHQRISTFGVKDGGNTGA
jgi:hypothetical protein